MSRKQRIATSAHNLCSVVNMTGAEIPHGKALRLVDASTQPGQVVIADSTTRTFYGVAYEPIPAGVPGNSQIRGLALVLLGEALAAGDRVLANDNGDFIWATPAQQAIGQLVSGGEAGDLVECELAATAAVSQMHSTDLAWRLVPAGTTRVIPAYFDLVISDLDVDLTGVLDIEAEGRLVLV